MTDKRPIATPIQELPARWERIAGSGALRTSEVSAFEMCASELTASLTARQGGSYADICEQRWGEEQDRADKAEAELAQLREQVAMLEADRADSVILLDRAVKNAELMAATHNLSEIETVLREIEFEMNVHPDDIHPRALDTLKLVTAKLRAALATARESRNTHICGSDDSGRMNQIREYLGAPDEAGNDEVVSMVWRLVSDNKRLRIALENR